MQLAMRKAKESGVGIVTVRRSRHYGMASYHAMLAMDENMIGISLTNNATPCVVPTYGLEPMFSTNPISAAVPVGNEIPSGVPPNVSARSCCNATLGSSVKSPAPSTAQPSGICSPFFRAA